MSPGTQSNNFGAQLLRLGRFGRARFFVVFVAFVGVNLLVWTWLGPASAPLNESSMSVKNYASPMYGTWTWWMVRAFVKEKRPADVVLLGSSQVNSPSWAADARVTKTPVDCLEHREVIALEKPLTEKLGAKQNLKVMNCAVQGGMASDYYMIERTLFAGDRRPPLVVLCVSPRDFIDNKLSSASATEPFRFFSRFSDAGDLTRLAYPDVTARSTAALESAVNGLPLRRLSDIFTSRIVALTDQSEGGKTSESVQAGTAADQTGAAAGQTRAAAGRTRAAADLTGAAVTQAGAVAKPAQDGQALARAIYNNNQQVKLGDWIVPIDMKGTFVDNSREYVARYANPKPKSYANQLVFFKQVLHDLKTKGCQVLVVQMPTLPCNRALLPQSFWTEYRQTLQSSCRNADISFSDLSEDTEFQKPDYVDTVHLNDRGGVKFFNKLAGIISGDSTLSLALERRLPASNSRTLVGRSDPAL